MIFLVISIREFINFLFIGYGRLRKVTLDLDGI